MSPDLLAALQHSINQAIANRHAVETTLTPREAFTAANLTHYRDRHGQIGHHRPSDPNCPCGPSEEKEDE